MCHACLASAGVRLTTTLLWLLPQVCGGCSGRSAGDMRAELAILVDAADLCCSWLAVEGSAPAAAAAHVVTAGGPSSSAGQLSLQQQHQDTQSAGKPIRTCEVSTPVCHELLRTIVCILGSALSTAATAAAADDDKLGVALPAAAAAAVGHDVWCSQWMWGEVGACLMHHLEAVVSYSSSNSSMGGESARLPVSTLDKYLEVSRLSTASILCVLPAFCVYCQQHGVGH